jgi:NADPH-dependent 2,4-dienoyl-CoA reductase/sulfur reductase-like enzyme/nitrite reductase/ring-hydroxylating ferredoxin subunit
MSSHGFNSKLEGPNLGEGVPSTQLTNGGMLLGHFAGEQVLLARHDTELFAIAAACSHYGASLAKGLLVGDTVRCPMHHACFSLRNGKALTPPALEAVATFLVEEQSGRILVRAKLEHPASPPLAIRQKSAQFVILGGGAAGHAAAETLRAEGFDGELTLVSAEQELPSDRPNLSKDYLAGKASEDWLPLRPREFFDSHGIQLRLGQRALNIDAAKRLITLEDGTELRYSKLLLATGAAPVKLTTPGAQLPHVFYLRSAADSRAIITALPNAKRAVIVGASFIALEVAAALRARGLEVHVVAPDAVPLGRVLGPQLGQLVRDVHEEHGVNFHLGRTLRCIERTRVKLDDGRSVEADLIVAGVGVRPNLALAERAGLALDRGVLVDQFLQTSSPDIYAAGDIARWPERDSGARIRIEHWVVAERQGQVAARNMLGQREPCDLIPFFWSRHYDVSIRYVGHAEAWDEIVIAGDVAQRNCRVGFRRAGRELAVATVNRDLDSLRAELAMESRMPCRGAMS